MNPDWSLSERAREPVYRSNRRPVTPRPPTLTLSDGSTYDLTPDRLRCADHLGGTYERDPSQWPATLERLSQWPAATPADLAAIHRAARIHAVGEAQADSVIVRRVRLIGTQADVYTAWIAMPDCSLFDHPYATITHLGGNVLHGALGSERMPADLDALPTRTDERYQAVTAWHRRIWAAAYAVIVTAHPGILDYATSRAYGHITVETDSRLPF